MDRKDKIASVAALALVAVIGGFTIAAGDVGRAGAYYYFSHAPDPGNNDLGRDFAIQSGFPHDASASLPNGARSVERTQRITNPPLIQRYSGLEGARGL